MVKSFFALRRRLAKADVDPHFGLRTSVRQQRPNSATAVTSLHHRRAPRSAAMTTAPGQQHGRAPRAMAVPHTSQLSCGPCDAVAGWNRHRSPPSSHVRVDLMNPGHITARQLWSCATTHPLVKHNRVRRTFYANPSR